MRLRTPSHLQDFLDAELAWRIKEISNMKSAVTASSFLSEATMARAALALLYAHWEGFVKTASTAYVEFVDNQRKTYSELRSCFAVFGLRRTLGELGESRKAAASIAAFDFVRSQLGERSRLKADTAIDTGSNLSSKVFLNILHGIGVDPGPYETKFNLIDESLLRRRNTIAHGEFIDIKASDWALLADEVLRILRQFKTDIENATTLSSYLVSSAPVPAA